MKVKINNIEVDFHIEGDRYSGDNTALVHHNDDLTASTNWARQGYIVSHLFQSPQVHQFQARITELIRHILKLCNLTDDLAFPLEYYHHLIKQYHQHLSVVDHAKLILSQNFPFNIKLIEKRVSEICQTEVHNLNPHTKERVFHFRIIRPNSNDNNPLHRDVWLEEYHDAINIYVPICGSNEFSSLTLIPGSHLWAENQIVRTEKGAKVNNIQFNVPALLEAKQPIEIIRPNPKSNEILVFSPYLLHGGAINLNENITRISLEMRFWRKKEIN